MCVVLRYSSLGYDWIGGGSGGWGWELIFHF